MNRHQKKRKRKQLMRTINKIGRRKEGREQRKKLKKKLY